MFRQNEIFTEIVAAEARTASCVSFLEDLHQHSQNWGKPPLHIKEVVDPAVYARWEAEQAAVKQTKLAAQANDATQETSGPSSATVVTDAPADQSSPESKDSPASTKGVNASSDEATCHADASKEAAAGPIGEGI